MRWRAGPRLFPGIWPMIQRLAPEDEFRAELVLDLIDLFQRCDRDGTDLRRVHPEIDRAVDELGVGEA